MFYGAFLLQILISFRAILVASKEWPHRIANVIVTDAYDNSHQYGNVTFSQDHTTIVMISGSFSGLPTGYHGIHIHSKGDISDQCRNAGDHFNPFQKSHGAPHYSERHAGDLGNIIVSSDGRAVINIKDTLLSLHGDNSIVGKSLVVHENEDDFGVEPNLQSMLNGNSGKRIACGTIKEVLAKAAAQSKINSVRYFLLPLLFSCLLYWF